MEGARGGPPPQLARRRTIAAAMPVFAVRTEGKLILYFTVICFCGLCVRVERVAMQETATLAL